VPQLKFSGTGTDEPEESVVLGQNRPNPFGQATTIPFELSKPATVHLSITDSYGRLLYSTTVDAVAGYNELQVSGNQIGATGLMFYTIETDTARRTKRMIIVGK